MNQTIEVEIDAVGNIHPVDPASQLPPGRAFLTWQNSPTMKPCFSRKML